MGFLRNLFSTGSTYIEEIVDENNGLCFEWSLSLLYIFSEPHSDITQIRKMELVAWDFITYS